MEGSGTLDTRAEDRDNAARTLIVDDEPRALGLTVRLLAQAGIKCLTAASAQEALEQLRAGSDIDVVLSDICMPATDGLEFLAQVRNEFPGRPWLQLLLITGQASVETAVAAIRLEASDYLLKPADPKALRESVSHALLRAASIRSVATAAGDSAAAQELRALASTAHELAARIGTIGDEDRGQPSQALESLMLLRKLQEARNSMFGQALMPEPAWEMLAELTRARLAGQKLSVTSLALASNSPVTTALRRIDDLIQGGLVAKVPDAADRRRTHVELTHAGFIRMQSFLEGFTKIVAGVR